MCHSENKPNKWGESNDGHFSGKSRKHRLRSRWRKQSLSKIRNCPLYFYHGAAYVWNRLFYDGIVEPEFDKLRDFPFYTDCHLYDAEGTEIRWASIVGTASRRKPAVIGRVYLSERADEKGFIHPIEFDAEWFQKIKITEK